MTPSATFTEHAESVLEALRAGASTADAARHNEVSSRTVKRWLQRGRENPGGPYGEFAADVDELRDAREVSGEPMSEDELRATISRACRAGSVQAMRVYWEILQADKQRKRPHNSLAQLDELGARRAGRRP